MNMDQELRDALRRKQAPADLADRVLSRINSAPVATATPRRSNRMLRWLAAAAVLAVTAGSAERYYTHQRAVEAARVQEEIRLALQITSETLAHVQSKLSKPAEDGRR